MSMVDKSGLFHARRSERGNVIFILFLAISLLAGLTMAVSSLTENQSNRFDEISEEKEVEALLGQGALMAGAVQQMLATGAGTDHIAAFLNDMPPTDANWDTDNADAGVDLPDPIQHRWKVYHPYGGGVEFMTGTSAVDPVADNFQVSRKGRIQGVGDDDLVDVLFTAEVNSINACASINEELLGSATIPQMASTEFDALLAGTDAATFINSTVCAGCVNQPRMCVKDISSTTHMYYQALMTQ